MVKNAFLFDADEPTGFEQALSRLCADDALREKLSSGTRATIEKLDLTWDGNARRVVGLAASLTSAARQPRRD